jgi:hypothetical protein
MARDDSFKHGLPRESNALHEPRSELPNNRDAQSDENDDVSHVLRQQLNTYNAAEEGGAWILQCGNMISLFRIIAVTIWPLRVGMMENPPSD